VVLDTCVCLDLFLFADKRCATLLGALDRGEIEAVTGVAHRDEWLRVLGYPQLAIDLERRAALETRFDESIALLGDDALRPRHDAVLPLCADPDDQKFLELARDSGATALVTKDRELLKLWRRVARAGLFAIVPPESLLHQALGDASFWATMRGVKRQR
jgi:putative PIN family toxin of toxin-antitoxin system